MPDSGAVAAMKERYRAFNAADPEGLRELVVPDVEWGATGKFPGMERLYRGPDAVVEWMETVRSEWQEFEVGLDEVLHDGGDLLVVGERLRGRGRESGVEVEMAVYAAYWFEGDKVRRRAAFTEREEALRAAGLKP